MLTLHASRAFSAGSSPRASEAEVLQLLGQLPKAMTARVAAAYKVTACLCVVLVALFLLIEQAM
jgi:hypothetical protein